MILCLVLSYQPVRKSLETGECSSVLHTQRIGIQEESDVCMYVYIYVYTGAVVVWLALAVVSPHVDRGVFDMLSMKRSRVGERAIRLCTMDLDNMNAAH